MTDTSIPTNDSPTPPKPQKSGFRKFLSFIGWTLVTLYFIVAAAILGVRYLLVPYVESQVPLIEQKVSALLGVPLKIGSFHTQWDYFNPTFIFGDVSVGKNNLTLTAKQVEGKFSYRTFLRLTPIFSRISIIDPVLTTPGLGPVDYEKLEAATGIKKPNAVDDSTSDKILNWLFIQRRIDIQNGRIDLNIPGRNDTLSLKDIEFLLQNSPISKKAALTFVPPEQLAGPLTLKADLTPPIGPNFTDIKHWNADLFASFDRLDLSRLSKWLPKSHVTYTGVGAGSVWMKLNDWTPASATFIGALSSVDVAFDKDLPPLKLNFIKGKVQAAVDKSTYEFKTQDLEFELASGTKAPALTSSLTISTDDKGEITGGKVTANELQLTGFVETFPSLPLPEEMKQFLIQRQLRGELKNVSAHWSGESDVPTDYSATMEFKDLSCDSYSPPGKGKLWLPGFKNFSGSLDLNPKKGRLHLNTQNASLALPGIFDVSSYSIDKLETVTSWDNTESLKVNVESLTLENSDVALSGSATYKSDGSPLGFLEAKAQASRGNIGAVWKFVPLIAGNETITWLRYGLLSGKGTDGKVAFRGPIHEFPFNHSAENYFTVDAKVSDAEIDFYPIKMEKPNQPNKRGQIWPTVSKAVGTLSFRGEDMKIEVNDAIYKDVHLKHGIVEIPAFSTDTVWLMVDAQAAGPLPSFLTYVNNSPIKGYTSDIFAKAQGSGNGELELALNIPLAGPGDVKVKGAFTSLGASINMNQFQIPDMTDVRGRVNFSEKGADTTGLTAKTYGQDVTVRFASNDKGEFDLKAGGKVPSEALPQIIPEQSLALIASKYLQGTTPFDLTGKITAKKVTLNIKSSLEGMESKLPQPLNKTATAKMPFRLNVETGGTTSNVSFTTSNILRGQLFLNNGSVIRGAIGSATLPAVPKRGFNIDFSTPVLSVPLWQDVLLTIPPGTSSTKDTLAFPYMNSIKVSIKDLIMDEFSQKDLSFVGEAVSTGWHAHLSTKDLTGDLTWKNAANGKEPELLLYMSKLYIPEIAGDLAEESKPKEVAGGWPSIHAVIDSFSYGKRNLGKVDLEARNTVSKNGHLWQIRKLNISNKDARLIASGSWEKHRDGTNKTLLILDNQINNLGGMLERLNFGKIIKAGKGSMKGELSWEGTPLGFNFQSFDGHLDLNLNKGEILKIEPGAGAKLLSVLSLQSLTRYLTLDFRDFFSSGFNFDSIIGTTKIDDGLMSIKDLTMVGSGATVITNGHINMAKESQDLKILVLPDINATGASIALAIANPIAGIGSFVAQLLLKDPLSKLFSFEYAVTGTWSDPIVKKIEKNQTSVIENSN